MGIVQDAWRSLRKAKAHLATVQEGISTLNASGVWMTKFLINTLTTANELVLSQTRERTRNAMRYHQQNGRRMSRADRCPYGWRLDTQGPQIMGRDGTLRPARMVQDQAEQAVIARMIDEASAGLWPQQIVGSLERDGLTCRGRPWRWTTVVKILKRAGVEPTKRKWARAIPDDAA